MVLLINEDWWNLIKTDFDSDTTQNAHMMSINGGTELLIYGGYDGTTTVDDIWYHFSTYF